LGSFLKLLLLPALLLTGSGAFAQNVTWSTTLTPGAPYPSHLVFGSNNNGAREFDITLGAGGSVFRAVALKDINKEIIPYDGTNTLLTTHNSQWSVQGPEAFNDGNATMDDRFILKQAGASNLRLAPVIQVEKNAQTSVVDVYSVAQDQWNTNQQSAVKTKYSGLDRYETLSDGSIKIRRTFSARSSRSTEMALPPVPAGGPGASMSWSAARLSLRHPGRKSAAQRLCRRIRPST